MPATTLRSKPGRRSEHPGSVFINGDYGNSDVGIGSGIEVAGTVAAGDIAINGEADDDQVNVTGSMTATNRIDIHGGAGDDTVDLTGTLTATEIRIYGEAGADTITSTSTLRAMP